MKKTDNLFEPADLPLALVLLSRVPWPLPVSNFSRAGAAAWAWPLVGLLLGGIAAALALGAQCAGLGPWLAAVLALGALTLLTGALHEDGLADVADGFWGGFEPARRLEIMKDSRIGAYGMIALIFGFSLRAGALAELGVEMGAALIAAAVLSRAWMAAVMAFLPAARADGLSAKTGQPPFSSVLVSLMLACAIVTLALGPSVAFVALLGAGAGALVVAGVAQAKIGGQTGDVLGASQQLGEIGALLSLCVIL